MPGGQSTAANSESRGRRLTGKPVTESNRVLGTCAKISAQLTVRAAAMSCIQDIRSWVFCASACRWGEARMGRWQAVGEIQIRHWFRKDTRTAGA